ncbi:putative myroilysin precursor [Diaporthe ampelina]|uniref:Putative myroilysin n=1 Tax=Diaporthe ampelina TaxID=1214573 RepID=A0A0G2G0G5_9PEZI|nr:putative myroilysin precursor [Diaporthe ampelina]
MNLGWIPEKPGVPDKHYRPTILHEFGHALGLTHEHQNYTEAWKWNMQAVYDYFAEEPNKWDPDTVDCNVFRVCKGKLPRKHFLDRGSIMLYAFPKQLFTDGEGTSENYELSDMDKAAMLVRYPGRDPGGYKKTVAMMSDKDGEFFIMRSCMGMEEDPVLLANSAVVGDWWPLGTSAS